MADDRSLFIVLGNQLFPVKFLEGHERDLFFMAEHREHCARYKFHKHRIIFVLSAMRHYAHELRQRDFDVAYFDLRETKGLRYLEILKKVLQQGKIKRITSFEIEDKFMESMIREFCKKNDIEWTVKRSPMFLVSRDDFISYLKEYEKPAIKSFYEVQRRRFNILMDAEGEPFGGRFSLDDENRQRWPGKNLTPKIPAIVHDDIDLEVMHAVAREFPKHLGESQTYWYPTTRAAAFDSLKDFCQHRLPQFGPYEEALSNKEDFFFHSVLSPLLNVGLLLPADAIKAALTFASENPVPLNSLEGFIRQILGWREFVRGVYQNYSEVQEQSNFWGHERRMNGNWSSGETGVPPLDNAIKKAVRLSYNHQTERLKVLSNMMNLAEIHPKEVHQWFMEMYLDSSEWVLGPNVYGMGLHCDGGVATAKPHVYSSSHWLKISSYKKADWCYEVDGLYWRFVSKNSSFFAEDPQLNGILHTYQNIPGDKKELYEKAAMGFLQRNTYLPDLQPQPTHESHVG